VPDQELKFDPIREWVAKAKQRPHHAPEKWDPFDRWLDNLEKRVRDLEEAEDKVDELRAELNDAQDRIDHYDGIEEAIQDVGRGVRTFPEVLERYDLDPHGIWDMPSPTTPARESATSEEIPLY
jgi:hypothetical protein